ncbi:DUF6544 family protein [Turneriella parva]|uniref:Uncharacterized protein n=1 Tax=Turneriella parva (strain ATCC BAA-1111 / DSM 21527 / NCTC 11395 / H) TaxID=869212 RepID=I4B660_TURPD|nr:DUF6544 family protein [Turneriella parva]AFM12767.1 hypothetical protein Turpa_2121 [Turneriella parva DSM 21527]
MGKTGYILLALLAISAGVVYFLIESRGLRTQYESGIRRMQKSTPAAAGTVTERDIQDLPTLVQKYLRVAGAVGREKIRNFRVVWDGALRSDKSGPWMSAVILQENFFNDYSRDFYLTAFMKGLPVSVWHSYQNQQATMQVKIASLISIVDLKGEELTIAETVTLFNDMCLLAPAALIDKRIRWRTVDAQHVEATFTNGKYSIKARLKFRENGELIDFISDDRYYLTAENKLRRERWSTPVSEYREFAGRRVVSRGEAIWHLNEGAFTYGRFLLKSIEYNVMPN